MNLLHLQQVSVVAHTTHNRLRPDLSPDLTSSPQPNQPPLIHVYTLHIPSPTTSYSRPHQNIPSILSFIYTQTLTRLIVNKLLTLYITIDILTFMWYNMDNGEGAFLYVKYLTMQC